MYFKIDNKESELYKKVIAYIQERREKQQEIYDKVDEFFDKKFKNLLVLSRGLNCLDTVTGVQYDGEIDGMKKSKTGGCLEPNKKTKRGKEIKAFFDSLPNWSFHRELQLLDLESVYGRFQIPYLEEWNGLIVARIDEKFNPKQTEDFIEITKTEFEKLTTK